MMQNGNGDFKSMTSDFKQNLVQFVVIIVYTFLILDVGEVDE